MTTNLAECMNGDLKRVHCLPVMALVEESLYMVAQFFNDRRQQVQAQINAGHVFCEDLQNTIFTNLEITRVCKVTLRNEDLGEFEFQHLHLPYIHVLAACADVTHEFGLYVDPVYKLETMLMAYSQPFHPIGGEEYWPHVPDRSVMPNPQALRSSGRPRSTRIRNEMDWKELGNKPKCSLCRLEGHTKKKMPQQEAHATIDGSWCYFLGPQSGKRGASSHQLPTLLALKRTAIGQERFFLPPTPHPLDEAPLMIVEKETESPSFPGPFD
ncbi:uncharacterized protein G2W53_041150 [Senna tora]|uniref:Uncharacterized protein n=1 Tax=Senna tora TaxID=362788 RepID=A0A834W2M7_9FABA|nr:uncharacterized protein G2W53_041150 [Senna tora]